MIYTIEYSKEADKTLRKWKKSNPNLFKKATKILMDIMQHPHDRIIYDIYDNRVTVLIVQAEEHYNDK